MREGAFSIPTTRSVHFQLDTSALAVYMETVECGKLPGQYQEMLGTLSKWVLSELERDRSSHGRETRGLHENWGS